MSAGGAFGGGGGPRPAPPDKGVFPSDHLHEWDLKKDYISCLKSPCHESKKCRLFSKKYLEFSYGKEFDGKTGYVRARIWKGSWSPSFQGGKPPKH